MKNVRVYRITDYINNEMYMFTGLSEADAQELYLAFIEGQLEEDIMNDQRIEYLNTGESDANYWRDYPFAEALTLLDGGYFDFRWYDAIEF